MELFCSALPKAGPPLLGRAQGLPGRAGAELRDARVMRPSRMKLISPLPLCSARGSPGPEVRPPAAADTLGRRHTGRYKTAPEGMV